MELSTRVSQDKVAIPCTNHFKANKVIYVNQKAANDLRADRPVNVNNATTFIKAFKAVIEAEVQKSSECIRLIEKGISGYRAEWQMLRKQLSLEFFPNERARILKKMAVNKEWRMECERYIFLIQQRAIVLQAQLQELALRN